MEVFTISPGERQHVEYLGDLFALITAIEKIEKANLRDLITQEEYTTTIRRLLDKYKSTVSHLETSRNPFFTTIDSFWENYCSKCPAARSRIQLGLLNPGAQVGGSNETHYKVDPRLVLECGQHFITLVDSLKLQQTAVDQLLPLLMDLLNGLRRLELMNQGFFKQLSDWRDKLEKMHASDELTDHDSRGFALILECGYQSFYTYLSENGRGKSDATKSSGSV